MEELLSLAKVKGYDYGALTIGESIDLATELNLRVSDVVIAEEIYRSGLSREEVFSGIKDAFTHNLYAIEIGLTSGSSFLMGTSAQELVENNFEKKIFQDDLVNKTIAYTIAAQIGNHVVGLEPCAGTGDSTTYAGLYRAFSEEGIEEEELVRLAAIMIKVGTIFRVGKTTTGCNMEGYGAGAAATAAVMVEYKGGTPKQMDKAMVLALSPTIGVPCTPRVMVAGLCSTHIGGAITGGVLAAGLAVNTGIPVTVPIDAMIAMAAKVHPISAKAIVPTVIEYMQPFFKTNLEVEDFIEQDIKDKEQQRIGSIMGKAIEEARNLAKEANPLTKPFGTAVVGGSSQAVGSPTNAGRIAHELVQGEIEEIKIELYPELFARRGINIPGILMGAVLGASTDDAKAYKNIMNIIIEKKIKITIEEVDIPQLQRVTIKTSQGEAMVHTLNRGGARLVIVDAAPSKEDAINAANRLGIVLTD